MLRPQNKYFNLSSFVVFLLCTATLFVLGNIIVPVLAATEEEDNIPPLIYNVNVSSINATSSVITWETDEYADSLLNYGLNKEYGIIRDPRADKIEHMIIVEDLAPDTQYFFRITSADSEGQPGDIERL
jgi:hypothetical protein